MMWRVPFVVRGITRRSSFERRTVDVAADLERH
jgi:hypothetical protein